MLQELRRISGAIYGWDHPLLTFTYPGFDCVSGSLERIGPMGEWIALFCVVVFSGSFQDQKTVDVRIEGGDRKVHQALLEGFPIPKSRPYDGFSKLNVVPWNDWFPSGQRRVHHSDKSSYGCVCEEPLSAWCQEMCPQNDALAQKGISNPFWLVHVRDPKLSWEPQGGTTKWSAACFGTEARRSKNRLWCSLWLG